MANAIDAFLSNLTRPEKPVVERLRTLILAASPGVNERIKWNAPSFGPGDKDLVTFRLPPKGGVQLIFHRGAKVKDATGFSFEDPTGRMKWAAPDRAVVEVGDLDKDGEAEIAALAARWISATT